jgi:hypothetical protein
VKEEGFVVLHEEVVELKVDLGNEDGETVDIRSDFRDGHGTPHVEVILAGDASEHLSVPESFK